MQQVSNIVFSCDNRHRQLTSMGATISLQLSVRRQHSALHSSTQQNLLVAAKSCLHRLLEHTVSHHYISIEAKGGVDDQLWCGLVSVAISF